MVGYSYPNRQLSVGPSPSPQPPPTVDETFSYSASTPAASSAAVLEVGKAYTVVVSGEWSAWADPPYNWPESIDAEVMSSHPPGLPDHDGHTKLFQLATGTGWVHVEPIGGPYSVAQPGHAYTYRIVGKGQPLRVRVADSPWTNNSGGFTVHLTGPVA